MQLVFNDQYRDFDWKYLKVMRVLSVCGLVCVTHTHTHTHRTFFPPRATRHTLRRPLPTAKRLLMCKQVTRRVRGITRVRMRRWRGSEAIAATRPASVPLASTRRSSAPAPTRMCMHVYMHDTNVWVDREKHTHMHTCIHANVHTYRACIHTSHMYLLGARYTMGALHTYSLRVSTGVSGAFCGVWRSLWRSRHC